MAGGWQENGQWVVGNQSSDIDTRWVDGRFVSLAISRVGPAGGGASVCQNMGPADGRDPNPGDPPSPYS